MRITLLFLLCLTAGLAFGGSWRGYLVDSNCFATDENNVNFFDGATDVDHDRNLEIVQCRPGKRTKSFTVIEEEGPNFKLDAAGNTKAAELVSKTDKKSHLLVTVTGDMNKGTVNVTSISLVR